MDKISMLSVIRPTRLYTSKGNTFCELSVDYQLIATDQPSRIVNNQRQIKVIENNKYYWINAIDVEYIYTYRALTNTIALNPSTGNSEGIIAKDNYVDKFGQKFDESPYQTVRWGKPDGSLIMTVVPANNFKIIE